APLTRWKSCPDSRSGIRSSCPTCRHTTHTIAFALNRAALSWPPLRPRRPPDVRSAGLQACQEKKTMAENGQAVIKLDGVTKVFFTDEVETHALSRIHLQIDKGEYVAIAGPSGCGKSTLLSILGL